MEQKTSALTVKFIWLYLTFTIVVIIAFGLMYFLRFNSRILQDARDHARDSAALIAQETDFSGHDSLTSPEQINSPTYQRIFDDLYYASSISPEIEYIYTMRPRDNGDWEFVVDADIEEDEDGNGSIDEEEMNASIGEYYDVSCCPQLPLALYGPTADERITEDIWGSWISGYAPIMRNNEVIGIVGVDISADTIVQQRNNLLTTTLVTLLITILLSSWLLYLGVYMTRKQLTGTK